MGECRFEHGDCVIHSPTAGPTTHRGPPALCLHAAADLERRLVTIIKVIQMHQPVGSPPPGDEAMLAAWVLNVLESRLACLEKELALWKESANSMKACWHAACHDIARLEAEKAGRLEAWFAREELC